MTDNKYQEFLAAAAQAVENQVAKNPTFGVPVDHDVAEHMGAFEEDQGILEAIDDEQPNPEKPA
jgi:hypothetical protein